MTEEEAILLAKRVAKVEGWQWIEPSIVNKQISRRSTKEQNKYDFIVSSNAIGADCNIWITINPDTTEVIDGQFHSGRNLPINLNKWKNK